MRDSLPPRFSKFVLSALLLAALAACAGNNKKDELAPDEPVNSLYIKGTDAMERDDYKEAAKQFAEVERQHPYSQWATRAQIMEAYADYLNLDYDDAIKVLDEFIELHPGNSDIAYAY